MTSWGEDAAPRQVAEVAEREAGPRHTPLWLVHAASCQLACCAVREAPLAGASRDRCGLCTSIIISGSRFAFALFCLFDLRLSAVWWQVFVSVVHLFLCCYMIGTTTLTCYSFVQWRPHSVGTDRLAALLPHTGGSAIAAELAVN